MIGSCLKEDIEIVPVNCKSLKTVIVVSSCRIVRWIDVVTGTSGGVVGRRIRREGLGSVPHRNVGIWRPNGSDHQTSRVEAVYVWPILVADPETAVCVQYDALRIDGDTLMSRTRVSETIPLVCCYWEVREAWI